MSTLHEQTIMAFGKLLAVRPELFAPAALSDLEAQVGSFPDDPVAVSNGLARWCRDHPEICGELGLATPGDRGFGSGSRSAWENEGWSEGPREKLNTLIVVARRREAPNKPHEQDTTEPVEPQDHKP